MPKQMLFKLQAVTDLRKGPRQPWSWALHGETIEGMRLTMRTAPVGRHEKRWIPDKLIGQTLRVTYHETRAGKLIADLWRPSWAEGADLDALFAQEQILYRVEQERQALEAASQEATRQMIDRQGPRRI